MVFGTAAGVGGFREKIGHLCRQLGEGGGVKAEASPNLRDGKLDVVAWKPFADSWQGKLMIFGQCKTGTHYRDMLMQLQPDDFCAKWLRERPPVVPLRAFLFPKRYLGRAIHRGVNGTKIPLTPGFSSIVAGSSISAIA